MVVGLLAAGAPPIPPTESLFLFIFVIKNADVLFVVCTTTLQLMLLLRFSWLIVRPPAPLAFCRQHCIDMPTFMRCTKGRQCTWSQSQVIERGQTYKTSHFLRIVNNCESNCHPLQHFYLSCPKNLPTFYVGHQKSTLHSMLSNYCNQACNFLTRLPHGISWHLQEMCGREQSSF